MKDINLMTPSELRALADAIEEEDRIVKKATLKHDLYDYPKDRGDYIDLVFEKSLSGLFLTKNQVDEIIEDFKNSFNKVLEKGDEFIAYKYEGELCWYNKNREVEDASDDWALNNLENFKDVT